MSNIENINNFLLEKNDSDRTQWLSSYISCLLELHKKNKQGTTSVRIKKNHTLLVVPTEQIYPTKIDNLSNCLKKIHPRYDRYLKDIFLNRNTNVDKNEFFALEHNLQKKRRKHFKFLCDIKTSAVSSWSRFEVVKNCDDKEEIISLLKNPENLILDKDETDLFTATTLSSRTLKSGKKIMIKRYNSKGLLYSLTRSLVDSRARVCWKAERVFKYLGIPTPNVLAVLEIKKGPWIYTSYLITDFIDGLTLSECFLDKNKNSNWNSYVRQVEDILFSLPPVLTAHGDFKSTNFMISNNIVNMIDLDSFKVFPFKNLFKKSYLRDIDRFEHNWIHSELAKSTYSNLITRVRESVNGQ